MSGGGSRTDVTAQTVLAAVETTNGERHKRHATGIMSSILLVTLLVLFFGLLLALDVAAVWAAWETSQWFEVWF
ncbi:MAG: hypothetical protein ABI068_05620 [Ktedonobacterales bacterium]